MSEETQAQATPRRVLVSMAHPDDIEFSCGATVAKWADEGQEIYFLLGTSGDKGSDDPKYTSESLMETREKEQRAAAKVLGVKDVYFLRERDAELVADLDLRKAITRVIRQVKPNAMICQDPTARYFSGYIQHPDHIAMGEATLAAIFPSARDRLTFPELLNEGLEPHKATEIYLSASWENADHFIDVDGYIEKQAAALREHKSQLGDWDPLEGLQRWTRDTASLARHKDWPGAQRIAHAQAFKYIKLDSWDE